MFTSFEKLYSHELVDRIVDGFCFPVPHYLRVSVRLGWLEFAFGDIYPRDGLTLQEREMVTITSLLTAGGCEPQLEVHINGALNVGIPPEKIIETFLQCVPYVGFPRVLNAVFMAKKVFQGRQLIP